MCRWNSKNSISTDLKLPCMKNQPGAPRHKKRRVRDSGNKPQSRGQRSEAKLYLGTIKVPFLPPWGVSWAGPTGASPPLGPDCCREQLPNEDALGRAKHGLTLPKAAGSKPSFLLKWLDSFLQSVSLVKQHLQIGHDSQLAHRPHKRKLDAESQPQVPHLTNSRHFTDLPIFPQPQAPLFPSASPIHNLGIFPSWWVLVDYVVMLIMNYVV